MIYDPIVQALGWRWDKFQGSESALKWNRRDIVILDQVAKMARGRQVAVQAGGNLGIFPKFLARSFKAVYTFEPAPSLFPKLVANAPEANIVRIQAALGFQPQCVAMSQTRRDGKTDNHEGITHVDGPGMIPSVCLDDIPLPACDLLQLDLEGWEAYALMGAERTIMRYRPVLCVEINKSTGYVGIPKEVVRRQIADYRYRFVKRLHSDEIWVPEEWE